MQSACAAMRTTTRAIRMRQRNTRVGSRMCIKRRVNDVVGCVCARGCVLGLCVSTKCVPTKYASSSVASEVYVFVREQVNCVVSAAAVWVRAAAALSELAVTPPRRSHHASKTCLAHAPRASCSELSGSGRARAHYSWGILGRDETMSSWHVRCMASAMHSAAVSDMQLHGHTHQNSTIGFVGHPASAYRTVMPLSWAIRRDTPSTGLAMGGAVMPLSWAIRRDTPSTGLAMGGATIAISLTMHHPACTIRACAGP
jgi:hypothetical protein